MKRNALYIHGFMGNPKGGTFETLNKTLKNWNIHSIPFPELHTEISNTQRLIKSYCKENNIELLIGASLGAFYVLQYEDLIDKLVINPCMYPSIKIPKLRDRETGSPIVLSEKVLNEVSADEYHSYAKALQELFDSFAIIDEFNNMLIVDCFNIIKICMKQYSRFGNKELSYSSDFEKHLNHFYTVMEDLYYYEIFGFFSTTVHPEDIPELNLPCKVLCGCATDWEKEPYLKDDGSAAYENVIRFRDPKLKNSSV